MHNKRMLVRAAERGPEESDTHKLNPRSEVHGWVLSQLAGLERCPVAVLRVPPGVAHNLRNPFGEDVVYLCGGERNASEVADYPRAGKRLVRVGPRPVLYPLEGEAVRPSEKL